jgi:hypothetical protein
MTIFEGILLVNLVITLYLAYATHKLTEELKVTDEMVSYISEAFARFIEKIAKEKIEAGEWTENETF